MSEKNLSKKKCPCSPRASGSRDLLLFIDFFIVKNTYKQITYTFK